jgi:hypothetical protein
MMRGKIRAGRLSWHRQSYLCSSLSVAPASRRLFWLCRKSSRQRFSDVAQNLKQHRVRKPASKCILLARMIRREQARQISRQLVTRPMPKRKRSQSRDLPALFQQSQISPHRDATEHEHGARLQSLQLPLQKMPAIRKLRRQWLVCGRRATQRRSHISILQRQTIFAIRRSRLIGKARAIERLVKKIAGAIAREHTSRAIRSMSRGRKPQYQKLRARIAEARNRLAPIIPCQKRSPLVPRDLFAIPYQPRARAAADNFLIQLFQNAQASLPLESYHEPTYTWKASKGHVARAPRRGEPIATP